MIHPMKKLTILLYHNQKDEFLKALQALGVLHLIDDTDQKSTLSETQFHESIKKAERILKVPKVKLTPQDSLKKTLLEYQSAAEIITAYDKAVQRKETIEQRLVVLKKENAQLLFWGDFNPQLIDTLRTYGISIRFFETTEKKFNLGNKENLSYTITHREAGKIYFAVFDYKEKSEVLDVDQIIVPYVSLKKNEEEIAQLNTELHDVQTTIQNLSLYQTLLHSFVCEKKNEASLHCARLSMQPHVDGKLLSVRGWFPQEKESAIRQLLDSFSSWYLISNPTHQDAVPVIMKNSPFSRLFEPITKIFSLPDYFEIDPTPFFAPFFTLFFGLCLGDIGYGGLLLLVSGSLYCTVKSSMKPLMLLGLILGCMTLLVGICNNSFFGYPFFYSTDSNSGILQKGIGLAFLRPLEMQNGTYFPAMSFALYLGFFQVILGIILKAINKARLFGIQWILQPLGSILVMVGVLFAVVKSHFISMHLFTIGRVSIGEFFSSFSSSVSVYLCIIGAALILFFNNPGNKNVAVRFGIGIWELYTFITGLMGNILSYLRLFALGIAGGLLGAAYNQLAFMVITSSDGIRQYHSPLILVTLLILVFGHTLNFALGMLGAFVHPLRLTFVEFYQNLDFKGGSKPFKPFMVEQ